MPTVLHTHYWLNKTVPVLTF